MMMLADILLSALLVIGAGVIATVVMARRLSMSTEGRALFAIRDAALSEAKERGAPLDFQQTQRGL